ncbi:MAG TPA: hypothetical protein PKD32_04820 [Saprospiraceae bacterium]|nr:hypothetical protein [Saprospiraceae bacterium]
MRKLLLFAFCFLAGFTRAFSQDEQILIIDLDALSYNIDWQIFGSEDRDEVIGTIRNAWLGRGPKPSEWDLHFNSEYGKIRLKWKNRQEDWELRLGNHYLSISSTWPGQWDSWRVSDNDKTYTISAKYDNEGFQWTLSDQVQEIGWCFNLYYSDFWTWKYQGNQEKMTDPLIMALVFLATYYSVE